MALSQTDLDTLDTAIATGTLEVQLAGRRVRYQSTEQLIKARAHVAAVLAQAGADAVGTAKRVSSYRFTFTTARGD